MIALLRLDSTIFCPDQTLGEFRIRGASPISPHIEVEKLQKIVLLALAGACGSLSRYWLSGLVYSALGRSFPWGTAFVNILGCLLFGLIWEMGESRMLLSAETRVILLTGFMGAFTTFSSLIFESGELLRQAQFAYAALNICGETLLGFACLYLGMALGRLI